MSPSPVQNDQERGWIIPIGGAENKLFSDDPENFLDLRRIICPFGCHPTASQLDDTG